MNIKQLRKFLIDPENAGYETGDSKKWIKEKDGSTTIPFESGDWRMHDNFFGGEPWGGREVVFYKGKPAWIMVMYGSVDSSFNDFETVYKFLQKALRNQPEDLPLRGPKVFREGNFVYKNKTEGDLENFIGKEEIYKDKKRIYRMNYSGGLVDQRKE
ncbi:MAG: DUF5680 domain-containing protein [Candidatus Levybacteria bacterium]|nr:DUF5680 domain-containing protein [Candidatus Levybacteria bacterium]